MDIIRDEITRKSNDLIMRVYIVFFISTLSSLIGFVMDYKKIGLKYKNIFIIYGMVGYIICLIHIFHRKRIEYSFAS